MLSLDRPGPARSRRQGQHVRDCDDLARVDALAGMLRCDAAGRYLSRLARTVLASRLRPAAAGAAGSGAAGTVFATERRARQVEIRVILSVPCLLGQCRVGGDGPGCESSECEHDCHRPERSLDGEQAAAGTGG